jgi:hypothetical protein
MERFTEGSRVASSAGRAQAMNTRAAERFDVVLHIFPDKERRDGFRCALKSAMAAHTCMSDDTNSHLQVCCVGRKPDARCAAAPPRFVETIGV